MSTIRRINYKKQEKKIPNFEIVDLQLFFSTRPRKLLEKDYRLNFWVVLYITQGEGRHVIDFEAFDYKSGDMLFIQKNQVQRFVVNNNVNGYIMHINEPFLVNHNQVENNVFLELIDRFFSSPVITIDNSNESTNRKLIEIIYKECNRNNNEIEESFIKSLFDSFILSISKQFTHENSTFKTNEYRLFKEYKDLVEQHYMDHLTIKEYAEWMGISKKTINQVTRSIADISAKAFINKRLLLEIKRYLSQGKLLNYEIADILGFDEPANMTKFFKREEGIAPKDFKKRLEKII